VKKWDFSSKYTWGKRSPRTCARGSGKGGHRKKKEAASLDLTFLGNEAQSALKHLEQEGGDSI